MTMPTNPTPRETLEQEARQALKPFSDNLADATINNLWYQSGSNPLHLILAAADRYAEAKVREVRAELVQDIKDYGLTVNNGKWLTDAAIEGMHKTRAERAQLTTPADQTRKEEEDNA